MTEIKKTLPEYYAKSRYIKAICTSSDKEFDRLYKRIAVFEKNRFIDTADENSIRLREKAFGITPDINDSLDVRRSKLKARLVGAHVITPENFKTVIALFGVSADIVEHFEDYSFTIIFHSPETSVSEDIIAKTIEELKPAHLAVDYNYRYYGTFEFGAEEYERDEIKGFECGYLGNIGSEEEL